MGEAAPIHIDNKLTRGAAAALIGTACCCCCSAHFQWENSRAEGIVSRAHAHMRFPLSRRLLCFLVMSFGLLFDRGGRENIQFSHRALLLSRGEEKLCVWVCVH